MLSQTADYALRAVLAIASHGTDEAPVRVTSLAEELRLPRNYLSKILHRLAHRGLLVSTRGKHGGFRMAVPAQELRLADVVEVFDSMEQRRQCLLGRPKCSDREPCVAHARWKRVSDDWLSFFRETTVAELLERESDGPAGVQRSAQGGATRH
jgi:Rrf2 family protein